MGASFAAPCERAAGAFFPAGRTVWSGAAMLRAGSAGA